MGSNGRSQPTYSTRIDIPADTRSAIIALLNQTLAASLDLKTQVKQAHWNVMPEYPLDIAEGKDHIVALADRYAIYGKSLRDEIAETDELGDADAADLYTEVSRAIDKRLWFLEAHLQTSKVVLETDDEVADKDKKSRTKRK